MLKPIQVLVGEVLHTFQCKHARMWPPLWSRKGATAAEVRSTMEPEQYEKARTWEKVCGLQAMQEDKCLSCPYVIDETGALVNGKRSTMPVYYMKTRLPR
jgi:hypothetical protein